MARHNQKVYDANFLGFCINATNAQLVTGLGCFTRGGYVG